VQVRRHLVQADRVAGHRPRDDAVDVAALDAGDDLVEGRLHRGRAERRDPVRLGRARDADAPVLEVGEAAQRLGAERHLCRVRVDGKQLAAVALAQHLLHLRPERRDAAPQRREVGVEAGEVWRADLDVDDRAEVEQSGAELDDAELDEAQHLLTLDAGAVEGDDLGGRAAAAQRLQLLRPERLLVPRVLVELAEAADDAQVLDRLRGTRRRVQRAEGDRRARKHAGGAPQRAKALASSRGTVVLLHWRQCSRVDGC
jgi:hypothetical protein